MPVYEYQCDDCKAVFTLVQHISEHEKMKRAPACPECSSKTTHRLFGSFFAKTSSKT